MKIYAIELINGHAYRTSRAGVAEFVRLNPGELQSWEKFDVVELLEKRDGRIEELETQVLQLEAEERELRERLAFYRNPQEE